ncbi:MAG: helix-turn-helix domain-containing protein [Ferrovibrio sp.]|uniref:AraC-like ligand-binding domain-containing protein n=1 Tax=Ferrovibrio sp. TaxID=1917215 RepID=UPI002608E7DA|nr:helix-turn-helix domain-containing protein [Ferrovibrio sp.]MCW0233992.1 helix-turn-helix domain-containing protein [Ferrovibrio sp.]
MSAIAVVSTSQVAPAERLALWGDFVGRHIGHLQSDTFGDSRFDGRLELGDIGGLKLCRIVASRHRVVRTPNQILNDDRGYVKIVAQIEGAGRFEQNGRKLILTPGEWSMYDTTRTYIVSNPEPINQLALLLPRDRLTRLGLNLDDAAVHRFSGRQGVGRLVFDLLSSAFAELPALAGPRGGGEFADTIANLVRLAVLDQMGVQSDSAMRETTRDRVKAFIQANLQDPMLSLDRVATAVGCTKRNLHKLFTIEDETLNSHIWSCRLDRVRQDLANPALLQRSITDIAFAWGFNSSTHFSRSFRERYGVAPRAYRSMTHKDGVFWAAANNAPV